MYPPELVAPMKADLTSVGFEELLTPEAVEEAVTGSEGSVLVVINSVCGCAAGNARPGAKLSLHGPKRPDKIATVFAGVDTQAVAKVRSYTMPYPPSSPSIALFKNGRLVHFIERHQIEGRPAEAIAQNLIAAYETYC